MKNTLSIRSPRAFRAALERGEAVQDVIEAARDRGTWTEGEIVECLREEGINADLRNKKATIIEG